MSKPAPLFSGEYTGSYVSWKSLPFESNNEYAFIGRSNVGKSSLINALTNRKKLALVSKTPGKTKVLNLFLINKKWNILDLPGYGYAKISQENRYQWSKMIMDYFIMRKNLVNAFVLIDCNIPPQVIDLSFINFLGEKQIPFSIVFTKTDKSRKALIQNNIRLFKEQLQFHWEELPLFFYTSSEKKTGIDELMTYIEELNNSIQSSQRI